jgi:uncharacterized protein (DUF1778 family)
MSTTTTRDDRKEIVAEHETLTLTPRDWEVFLAALNDDRPRPRLRAAVRRYQSRRHSAHAMSSAPCRIIP